MTTSKQFDHLNRLSSICSAPVMVAVASCLLTLVCAGIFVGPKSHIQTVGALSRTDVNQITSVVRRKVLADCADMSRGGSLRRLPGALKYWRRHPIETIEVKTPDTVHVLFSKRNFGDVLGYEYDYNILGYKVVRSTNGWVVSSMLVKL